MAHSVLFALLTADMQMERWKENLEQKKIALIVHQNRMHSHFGTKRSIDVDIRG